MVLNANRFVQRNQPESKNVLEVKTPSNSKIDLYEQYAEPQQKSPNSVIVQDYENPLNLKVGSDRV